MIDLNQATENPLDKLLTDLLQQSLSKKTSDIHFEAQTNCYRMRLRVNGLLERLEEVDLDLGRRLINKLKLSAGISISENRLPQDGKLSLKNNNKEITCRLSTCNTVNGEKLVIRILQQQSLSLEQLQLNKQQRAMIENAITKTQGLILVCGPTGSGKTTTLYAALQHINSQEKNILTIEDPVEIFLEGVNQTSIPEKLDFGFHNYLRTALRQDPDVIMVGEIRDKETAQAAIKAAQTGHLVFSTLHSNSALKAISRLRNLGISHYDLADSLSLVISQRLVRKIEGETCVGREAVFEILQVDEVVAEGIEQGATSSELMKLANRENFYPLKEIAGKQGCTDE